jgi:hypothetical protein
MYVLFKFAIHVLRHYHYVSKQINEATITTVHQSTLFIFISILNTSQQLI